MKWSHKKCMKYENKLRTLVLSHINDWDTIKCHSNLAFLASVLKWTGREKKKSLVTPHPIWISLLLRFCFPSVATQQKKENKRKGNIVYTFPCSPRAVLTQGSQWIRECIECCADPLLTWKKFNEDFPTPPEGASKKKKKNGGFAWGGKWGTSEGCTWKRVLTENMKS